MGTRIYVIHGYFHKLIVGQRNPGFLGCHSLVLEHRMRLPRLDGMGLDHCMHCVCHVALHGYMLCELYTW